MVVADGDVAGAHEIEPAGAPRVLNWAKRVPCDGWDVSPIGAGNGPVARCFPVEVDLLPLNAEGSAAIVGRTELCDLRWWDEPSCAP